MNHPRVLRLFVLAAAALMAFAGSASATTGTRSANSLPVTAGDIIHGVQGSHFIISGIGVTCKGSTFNGEVENAGSATTTLSVLLAEFSIRECGSATVSVYTPGTLEIHTDQGVDDGNGTVTSNGFKVTVLTHNILGTVHCNYKTENSNVGTLIGSNNTGGTATLTIDSAPIPQEKTDVGCGSTPEWSAEYTIATQDYLSIH